MVNLTEMAAQRIKEFRVSEKIADDQFLRVKVSGGGCSGFIFDLFFDARQEDDIDVTSNDIHIIVDNMSIMYLDGINIDYIETLQGAGFKFAGGGIKSTCGCGSSASF